MERIHKEMIKSHLEAQGYNLDQIKDCINILEAREIPAIRIKMDQLIQRHK